MALLALAGVVVLLAALTWIDYRQYANFKLIESSPLRRRRLLFWTAQSFGLCALLPAICLAASGRLADLVRTPPAFGAITRGLRSQVDFSGFGPSLLVGLAGGMAAGAVISALLKRRRSPRVIGDITPLMPRNHAELACTTLLAINAGVSEEIGFRLALPLLAYAAFGNATAAFVFAGAVFAGLHIYQGWIGVVVSGVLGAALTLVYLASGQLWLAMLIHALIDLNGLALAPWLSGKLKPARAG